MDIPDDVLRESKLDGQPVTDSILINQPAADSAMATGTDDEPEMTIADKHAGEMLPDPNGDGELTSDEAATLLGDTSNETNT